MVKNVAIKTVYGEFNIGNKLQNYAVVVQLKKHNLNPTTIQYIQLKFLKNTKGKIKENIKSLIYKVPINISVVKKVKIGIERISIFKEFSRKYLNISEVYNENNLNESYINSFDMIVIGSDQVWNDNDMSKKDLEYFLGISDTKPIISLSASFGIEKIKKDNNDIFKQGLSKMSNISVRETSGQKIINDLISINSELLVDPTMLVSKDEWNEISKAPDWYNSNSKYILCYFLGGISKYKDKIVEYANLNKLEVIDILDKKSIYHKSGPEEFIYLVNNAQCIFTDSFHGCVFSIIFNKYFICFERDNQVKSMNSRLTTLLSKFELENMMFNDEIKINEYDFDKVNYLLYEEKEKASNYINECLKNIN